MSHIIFYISISIYYISNQRKTYTIICQRHLQFSLTHPKWDRIDTSMLACATHASPQDLPSSCHTELASRSRTVLRAFLRMHAFSGDATVWADSRHCRRLCSTCHGNAAVSLSSSEKHAGNTLKKRTKTHAPCQSTAPGNLSRKENLRISEKTAAGKPLLRPAVWLQVTAMPHGVSPRAASSFALPR